ncbi:MAG: LPS-assembly protein LptD [Rhizobiaceae bacterium]|nr:LPS-assembly protein LptD [Rhizobiaceae bacterium]
MALVRHQTTGRFPTQSASQWRAGEGTNAPVNITARARKILLAGTLFFATVFVLPTVVDTGISANAQNIGSDLFGQRSNPDAQLLLEADQLKYDDANQRIAAVGNVQIAYDGYTLVARQVTYDRNSGRVIATGNVEIIEPNGNRIFAEEIDITDNFSDGFISALRVESADETRFAADSGERVDGNVTILNNGVYTACKFCKDNPTKPPLWQIRARKITINNDTKEVSYEKASFELFGKPIAYLPYFAHADPAIRRKSGFLIPNILYREELGIGVSTSYFFNLAPNYDLTLSATYYSQQGFLGQAEWRQRTQNGQYNLQVVGISQQNPADFDNGTYDQSETNRLAAQTSGKFAVNRNWTFGWQYLYQSDRNFTRTYNVTSQAKREVTNEIYLTGLKGKNYFDVRAQKFLIQEDIVSENRQNQQAILYPLLDYNYVVDGPVAGGQLSYNINLTNIDRRIADNNISNTPGVNADDRYYGIAGKQGRLSANLEWKTNFITNSGLMITPSLQGQVDSIWQNTDNPGSLDNPLLVNQSMYRAMPTAGLEIRYPLVAQDGFASYIFEPIAQIFASTDETNIGQFANEDAQSMVFDTTNLFSRNKFSGYDRIEGGVRANIGFRYSASFNSGGSLDVAAGQSFQIAGLNSFTQRDLVNAGLESGLESKRSDYVASAQLNSGTGFSVRAAGRFDEKTLEVRRGEVDVTYVNPDFSTSLNYTFIDAQPNYAFPNDRHQASLSGSVKLSENWRAFGKITYDLETSSVISDSLGIAYDDPCFSFSVAYSENRAKFTGEQVNQSVTFNIGFRTIGNYGNKLNLDPFLE